MKLLAQMQGQGCRPDVVTYTALIQAHERGGQPRRALAAFLQMKASGCEPDAVACGAIVDALWDTGVAWAQRQAANLHVEACAAGLMRRHAHSTPDSLELNLHSTTAGVALLSLHSWLGDLM
jgi:pentatricopeptide repeat protein